MNIGEKIKLERKLQGLSQSQLALKLNITKQIISLYEKNKKRVPYNELKQIAVILKKPLSYFSESEKDTNNKNFKQSKIQKLNIGHKIKLKRIEKKLTQKQLAEKLNVSQGTINKYELSQRDITLSKLIKIAEILSTPLQCLLCEENMYKCKGYFIQIKKIVYVPIFNNLIKNEILENSQLSAKGYLPIKKETINKQQITGALKVQSDSMELKILKGSYVLINNKDVIKEGDIVLLYIKEEGTIIREIHFLPNNIIKLIPFNKKYHAKNFKSKQISILGKIIGSVNYYMQFYK